MERSGMLNPTCTSLSHDTERCLKTKATNLYRGPPLIMHIVVASWVSSVIGNRLFTFFSVDCFYVHVLSTVNETQLLFLGVNLCLLNCFSPPFLNLIQSPNCQQTRIESPCCKLSTDTNFFLVLSLLKFYPVHN